MYCINNQTQQETTLDINETDRWIMLSPEDWGKILYRLRRVRKKTRGKLRKDINNILEVDKKMLK